MPATKTTPVTDTSVTNTPVVTKTGGKTKTARKTRTTTSKTTKGKTTSSKKTSSKTTKGQTTKGKTTEKKLKTFGTRREVWNGKAKKTAGGLTKDKLVLNPSGRVVSKAQREKGLKQYSVLNRWRTHLDSFRAEHPNLSLKEQMIGASKTYKKKATTATTATTTATTTKSTVKKNTKRKGKTTERKVKTTVKA
jgi:hypothetical protein